ncbi:MAG: tol-pal system protein YbgF [Firmicutes bacterium]|nr:tol-pal system protein YbgF [Bacillota bacterium]
MVRGWWTPAAGLLLSGALLLILGASPTPAQRKEILEMQRDIALLTQSQRELQRSLDEKHAVLRTLLEQSLDAVNRLQLTMATLEKNVRDVQANTGARMDTLATQVQALADNLEEVKVRMGRLQQQMVETQGVMQTLDARLAGGAVPGSPTGTGETSPGAPAPRPPSPDVLYSNALRDLNSGKYDLARQEFLDYLKYYPDTDLASNAQFYLGEILYAEKKYQEAIAEYDKVLNHYPKSFKFAAARLKKALALLELGQRASGVQELREVVRRHPGTEEERRARAKLRELGINLSG